jgi:hypothetical protein
MSEENHDRQDPSLFVLWWRAMPTEHIISLLIQERDRLNRAIEALDGRVRRRGRKMAVAQAKRWAALKVAK